GSPFGYSYPFAYPYPPGYFFGPWASARIEVKPKEAQVYLDGYYVGIVDQFDGFFQRLDIPTGEHELSIYMPGYRTLRERMLFRPGQNYHFKETMQPLAAGEPQEPKPQPDPNAAPRNAPGPYPNAPYPTAPYPNAPYPNAPYPNAPYPPSPGPYRQPPPPPAGEPRMEPVPPGAPQYRGGEFGTLNLRVQPEDAVVTVDGQHWDNPQGGSRLTVQLAPGRHRIEVRKDGFRNYSSTIEIRPGEPQTLNISLTPQN
ncbi:MAG TPA: PEGA domain-containing protein, partial [Vicinamibacterales bacterium]